ncbi:hypothetical protein PENARI_c001G01483 [Penicillium arizonense]|uniref:Uncharacterized protein n=1 Tax=Penicillium arizonense TaxID=1835702 RepID=A0A1F5LZ55_PENAI|nr:hypothetical protein PENARI_c001G01483 [Penicillium arizonense]OGE58404.1 hypothetical protein PENARI_c001G01483 [Penicillium arizonense]
MTDKPINANDEDLVDGMARVARPTSHDQSSPGLTSNFTVSTGLFESVGSIDSTLMDPTMPSLDELWQAFDESVDSAAVDWNTLFTELDAPFLSL